MQTSSISVGEESPVEYIETDHCIAACGAERMTVGFSTDVFSTRGFTTKLCSPDCRDRCSNLADLYSNMVAGEGTSLLSLQFSRSLVECWIGSCHLPFPHLTFHAACLCICVRQVSLSRNSAASINGACWWVNTVTSTTMTWLPLPLPALLMAPLPLLLQTRSLTGTKCSQSEPLSGTQCSAVVLLEQKEENFDIFIVHRYHES